MSFNQDPSIRRMVHGVEDVIEEGWKALLTARKIKHVHLSEKEIFFSGASFLFDAIIHSVGIDREPTAEDFAIIAKLHKELERFNTGFNAKITGAPSR